MKRRFQLYDFYLRKDGSIRNWVYIPFINIVISLLYVVPMFLALLPCMASCAMSDCDSDLTGFKE